MATKIRPTTSKKKDYWISKHRYYELKHFCLQYPEWKKEFADSFNSAYIFSEKVNSSNVSDPTAEKAIKHILAERNMHLIEDVAKDSCGDLACYIFKNVTRGIGYNETIPCSKNTYYRYYRLFFAMLNVRRK